LDVDRGRCDAEAFFAFCGGVVFGRALAAFGLARAALVFDAFAAGLLDAFAGLLDAFAGLLDAFVGLLDAFAGLLDAFAVLRAALRGALFLTGALRGSAFLRAGFFLLDFLAAMVGRSLARVRARLRRGALVHLRGTSG
jgi:hypothetical protein